MFDHLRNRRTRNRGKKEHKDVFGLPSVKPVPRAIALEGASPQEFKTVKRKESKQKHNPAACLDLIVAELVDHLARVFRAPLALPAAVVQGGPALRGAPVGRIGRGGAETTGRRRPCPSSGFRQHAVLGLGGGPVHALLDVLLHADPVAVADLDAAAAPLVVVGALLRVAQDLLGLLWGKTEYGLFFLRIFRICLF